MKELSIQTGQRTEILDITSTVETAIEEMGIRDGILFLYCPHTTAAVAINEGYDPAVRTDVQKVLDDVIPFEANYDHAEGNSAAHIKSVLVGPSELIPVQNGRLKLGRWQSIYFMEFDGPRSRTLWVRELNG